MLHANSGCHLLDLLDFCVVVVVVCSEFGGLLGPPSFSMITKGARCADLSLAKCGVLASTPSLCSQCLTTQYLSTPILPLVYDNKSEFGGVLVTLVCVLVIVVVVVVVGVVVVVVVVVVVYSEFGRVLGALSFSMITKCATCSDLSLANWGC